MKINKLNKILVAAMLVIVAVPACLGGGRTPTPIPTPTPTPVTVQEFYNQIEGYATRQPAILDRLLDEKSVERIIGTVTNTENGVIQFHLNRPSGNFDKYIECKMSDPQDAEKVSIGDTIVVRGQLKDAFNEKKRFGSLMGARNNNIIELEGCTIQRN